jgi:hypothetical protein
MANLLKALFISSLMSGSFLTNAMDWSDRDSEDARLSSLYGMSSVEEYRQSPFYEHRNSTIYSAPSKQPEPARAMNTPSTTKDELLAKQLGISVEELRTALMHEQQRNQSYQNTTNSNQQARAINTPSTTTDVELAKQLGISVEELRTARMHEQQRNQSYQTNNSTSTAERKRKEEEATAAYFRNLKEEEEKQSRLRQEEEASAAYFHNLKLEEKKQASIYQPRYQDYTYDHKASFIFQVNLKSFNLASGPNRPTLEHFMRIRQDLHNIPQESDVHVLDQYIFGSGNNIKHLVDIGKLYDIDNPNLTLATVGQQMVQFINEHKNLFSNFQYNNNPVSIDNMIAFLNSHFSNMDNEISICPDAREIWSRAWTLALKLHNESDRFTPLQIIFDQAIEGHMTRGGCIQGRIDRGFVGYAILLGEAGVGIF